MAVERRRLQVRKDPQDVGVVHLGLERLMQRRVLEPRIHVGLAGVGDPTHVGVLVRPGFDGTSSPNLMKSRASTFTRGCSDRAIWLNGQLFPNCASAARSIQRAVSWISHVGQAASVSQPTPQMAALCLTAQPTGLLDGRPLSHYDKHVAGLQDRVSVCSGAPR